MAKMSLEDLRKLREEMQTEIKKRETEGKTIQIIIGMGTCGISAGAKDTLDAFISILDEKKISGKAIIRQTGCMGRCSHEPTVEVIVPDMPTVVYGNVTPKVAAEIVETHIEGKKLLDNLIVDKPSIDVVK
ncbi:MAG: (2Fe-2S) ferredoxin domain-containing protein [Spirochaetaceae bacterium]|nr:(2Fe-2S) ferredoxin domain-containing protein [Spirochaetaceae bacterium]